MRFLLLLGLLSTTVRSWAQTPDSVQHLTMSLPLELSPLASLNMLPQRVSPDDSLRQRAFRRNRVKTVTLVQLRGTSPADTVDYTEVDRHGNILFYRPTFGQRYRQRYNRKQQLVLHTRYPTESYKIFSQATYDPATHVTITRIGPSLNQLAPWQVARSTSHGDTLVLEAFFHPMPQLPGSPLRRLVVRTFRVRADTVRTDVLAYDVAEQLMQFESYYRVESRQHPRETGQVSFGPANTPDQRPTPSTARHELLASQRMAGRYMPNSRYTYNAHGSLVRTFFIPLPHPDKSTTTISADGRGSMTISAATDTSSVRYVRTPEGQLLREEYRFSNAHLPPGEIPWPEPLSFTQYTYLPNGLRQTKAGSLAVRYEYRYTFY
jgi:hypothetical protein